MSLFKFFKIIEIKKDFKILSRNTKEMISDYERKIHGLKVLSSLLLLSIFPLLVFFIASLKIGHYEPSYLKYFIYAIVGTVTATITYFIMNWRKLTND